MRKLTIAAAVCVGVLSMGVATATAAKPSDDAKAAKAMCVEQKNADKAAFQALWGKHAMRDCKAAARGKTKAELEEEVAEFKNAAKECRAEEEADPAAFAETYGTNANKKNAFGKCVSSKVSEDDEAEEDGTDA